MRLPIRIVLAVAAVLVTAAPAQASEAFTEESTVCQGAPKSDGCLTHVYLRAAPGEVNRVTAHVNGGDMVVADAGAPVTPGFGCRLQASEIRCALREGRGDVLLYLYDGDDTAELTVHGVAYGGEGRDALTDRGRLAGIPRALFGGPGNDVLRGSPNDDILDGDAGADRIVAGDGDDTIYGGGGRDRILAGRGDDRIRDRDGARDSIDCGAGRDDFARVDRRDSVRGCER